MIKMVCQTSTIQVNNKPKNIKKEIFKLQKNLNFTQIRLFLGISKFVHAEESLEIIKGILNVKIVLKNFI